MDSRWRAVYSAEVTNEQPYQCRKRLARRLRLEHTTRWLTIGHRRTCFYASISKQDLFVLFLLTTVRFRSGGPNLVRDCRG